MNLYDLTVHELVDKLKNKEITLEDVNKSYIERINEKENDVKAFVTRTDENAIEKAKKNDEDIKNGK